MEIRYNNCEYGIGIRIIGGIEYNRKFYNIYIREILTDGLAYEEGRLSEGDQLLSINDVSCINIVKEKAIELLRNACSSGSVKLLIKKYDEENFEFIELLKLEKLLNIGSDDEDVDADVEEDEEEGLSEGSHNNNGINKNFTKNQKQHKKQREHKKLISNSNHLLHSEIDDDDDDDNEDETKLYDENDERFNNDSNLFERTTDVQKLMTSQYLSDPNLNYQQNQEQYYLRANKAALLEQQYMNMNMNMNVDNADLISFSQERDAYIDEIRRLENELTEKDKNCNSYKEQLYDLQQKVCEYLNEIMQLRQKLSIAEDCQKEAIKIEQEYKQIIKFLKMNLTKSNTSSLQRTSPP